MSKALAVAKLLVVTGAIFGVAHLIGECLDCQAASRAGRTAVVAVCAIVMASLIGLQFWYIFGKFLPSSTPAEELEASRGEDRKPPLHANAAINVAILGLAGVWVVGATSSLYPAFIPLTFFVVGVTTVLLLGAGARISRRVRAALAPGHGRWVAFSSALATLIVIAVVVYQFDSLREHPILGLICAAICLVMTSCGIYRSGVTKENSPQGDELR